MTNRGFKLKFAPLTKTALLCAVSIVLSAIENMIPQIPFFMPGMKLGLSNIAVVFALETVNLPCAVVVVIFKGLFALLTRGVTAGLMSFCGSLLGCLAMFFLLKIQKPRFGYIGVAVCGAFFHNFAQLLVSLALMGKAVFSYLFVLSLSSLVTGAITGVIVGAVMPSVNAVSMRETEAL